MRYIAHNIILRERRITKRLKERNILIPLITTIVLSGVFIEWTLITEPAKIIIEGPRSKIKYRGEMYNYCGSDVRRDTLETPGAVEIIYTRTELYDHFGCGKESE